MGPQAPRPSITDLDVQRRLSRLQGNAGKFIPDPFTDHINYRWAQ